MNRATMRWVRFLVGCVLLTGSLVTARAGTLHGTIRNATTGKPAANTEVVLIQLQGGMQPVANTKTDASGQFSFDNPSLGAQPMLVRAVYQGVNFHQPVPPGKNEIQVVRAGGTLTINGRKVIGKEFNFPEFQPGDEYLLYLKYIPETGFYKAVERRSFNLSHGPVIDAPYMDRDWATKVPIDELLQDTKAAISAAGTAAYCGKAVNQ